MTPRPFALLLWSAVLGLMFTAFCFAVYFAATETTGLWRVMFLALAVWNGRGMHNFLQETKPWEL